MRSVLVLAALAGTSVALAQDARVSPLPNHLPVGVEACYGRAYDAAHLRAHPQQRVTSFHIFRDFVPDTNSEEEPSSRAALLGHDGEDGRIGLTAYVRVRDRQGVFSNWFTCKREDNGTVLCGIDCDGGTFHARPSGTSLLIENHGFVVLGGCEASDEDLANPIFIKPDPDDKTFRLDKQPVAQCAALRDAKKPAWAKLGSPLRERFAKAGALCLTRAYDAAHLASHPQQSVKRIAILKTADDAPHHPPQYNLSFRVELKDGQRLEAKTNCWPDNYAYTCTHAAELDTVRSFYLTRAGDYVVMLRDRKGSLAELFKHRLEDDDRMFRLSAAPASECDF